MDGINPELSNLTCSLTFVKPGDIVFLTSDGVSDNFDPVVGKFCVPAKSDAQSNSIFKLHISSESILSLRDNLCSYFTICRWPLKASPRILSAAPARRRGLPATRVDPLENGGHPQPRLGELVGSAGQRPRVLSCRAVSQDGGLLPGKPLKI